MALVVALVVVFFLPQGPGGGDRGADALGSGNGEVNVEMDPVYVIRIANRGNIGRLMRGGGKGELVIG